MLNIFHIPLYSVIVSDRGLSNNIAVMFANNLDVVKFCGCEKFWENRFPSVMYMYIILYIILSVRSYENYISGDGEYWMRFVYLVHIVELLTGENENK